jgi:hypothetical protein
MYQFIYSLEELKYFYDNILPPLAPTEVYFVSLSGRNKYLTEKEKREFQLGRTEMFCKTIIRKQEWDRFLRTIRKFEVNDGGYTTKNNFNIPQKCITCYININPSETLQSLKHFNNIVNEYMDELAHIALDNRKNSNNISERLNKLDNNLMTCYQQSRGIKHWIDIDMDVPKIFDFNNYKILEEYLNSKKIFTFHLLNTKSGYHLLIKKSELKMNPEEICNMIINNFDFNNEKIEVIINKNEMIPIPGTLQGDYPVKILYKKGN